MSETLCGYQVHACSRAWPPAKDTEVAMLEESVRLNGVSRPIVLWKDADGVEWLMDGRTRATIIEKLLAEGAVAAENGVKIELPKYLFRGSESECIEYVKTLQMGRETNSLQRAAICINLGELERLTVAKERGVAVSEISRDYLEGDLADKLAQKWNSNRSYIHLCQSLKKKAPKVLGLIVSGDVDHSQARSALRRVDAGKTPFPAAGEKAEEAPAKGEKNGAPEPEEAEVCDGAGTALEKGWHKVFSTRERFVAMAKELRKLAKGVGELADSDGGKYLPRKSVMADLRNIAKVLEDVMPHLLCDQCGATGKVEVDGKKKKCPKCKGVKWVDRIMAEVVTGAEEEEPEAVGAGA